MNAIKNKLIQKAFTIQGVTLDTKNKEYGQIPSFNISNRRHITDYFSKILEHKNITNEFDAITVDENLYPGTPSALVFEVGLITDFWYGFKNVRLSNTGYIILHHNETFKQIKWGQDGTKHYPIIQTDKREINPKTL